MASRWNDQKVGPRFRSTARYENIADPAKGEPVRRCFECGRPETNRLRVLDFELTYAGKAAGRMRWCEADWLRHNPRDPRDTDPLTVEPESGFPNVA